MGCLFLIRPDHHVALRSEPLRKDAVLKYFDGKCGVKMAEYSVPASSTSFDPLPVSVHSTIFTIIMGCCASNSFAFRDQNVLLGMWTVILGFLIRASKPPNKFEL